VSSTRLRLGKPTKGARTRSNKSTDKIHHPFASREEETLERDETCTFPFGRVRFVDVYCLNEGRASRPEGRRKPSKNLVPRRLHQLCNFVALTFQVHMAKNSVPVLVDETWGSQTR